MYALYNITNTTAACLYDDDTMTIATTVAVKPAEKKTIHEKYWARERACVRVWHSILNGECVESSSLLHSHTDVYSCVFECICVCVCSKTSWESEN